MTSKITTMEISKADMQKFEHMQARIAGLTGVPLNKKKTFILMLAIVGAVNDLTIATVYKRQLVVDGEQMWRKTK